MNQLVTLGLAYLIPQRMQTMYLRNG